MNKSNVAVLSGASTRGNHPDKVRAMLILLGCEVLVMTVWFSSTAVIPQISEQPGSTPFRLAALTSAVQVGFVLGTLLSALLRLADGLDPLRYFMGASMLAAGATLCLVWLPAVSWPAILLRVLTGMALAGVYPIGLRLAATWATNDLGLLMGLLVGALTLGSAAPHLVSSFLEVDYRLIYVVAAAAAATGGLGIRLFTSGHRQSSRGRLQLGQITQMWKDRPLRLANIGYLGHMWELYACGRGSGRSTSRASPPQACITQDHRPASPPSRPSGWGPSERFSEDVARIVSVAPQRRWARCPSAAPAH